MSLEQALAARLACGTVIGEGDNSGDDSEVDGEYIPGGTILDDEEDESEDEDSGEDGVEDGDSGDEDKEEEEEEAPEVNSSKKKKVREDTKVQWLRCVTDDNTKVIQGYCRHMYGVCSEGRTKNPLPSRENDFFGASPVWRR